MPSIIGYVPPSVEMLGLKIRPRPRFQTRILNTQISNQIDASVTRGTMLPMLRSNSFNFGFSTEITRRSITVTSLSERYVSLDVATVLFLVIFYNIDD